MNKKNKAKGRHQPTEFTPKIRNFTGQFMRYRICRTVSWGGKLLTIVSVDHITTIANKKERLIYDV